MKIKAWLLIMFFIVMVLPIVGAYSLYVWINAYYQDKNVAEFFDKWTELNHVKDVVDNPMLYQKMPILKRLRILPMSSWRLPSIRNLAMFYIPPTLC